MLSWISRVAGSWHLRAAPWPRPPCCGLAPPLANRGADLAAIRRWFDTWVGPIDLDLQELRIDVADGLAVSTGLSRMRGIKTDGLKVDLWVRATMAYRKVDGRWTVIHEHVSVPFYMDGSERAALDLKP